MSTPKKSPKTNIEDAKAALQSLIAQGKKAGMIQAAELNAVLEKLQLSDDKKIDEIYAAKEKEIMTV